jgi:hypothetical protein
MSRGRAPWGGPRWPMNTGLQGPREPRMNPMSDAELRAWRRRRHCCSECGRPLPMGYGEYAKGYVTICPRCWGLTEPGPLPANVVELRRR